MLPSRLLNMQLQYAQSDPEVNICSVYFPSYDGKDAAYEEKKWIKMDGKVFVFRQCRHFPFIVKIIKVLFPICTLTRRVKIWASRQGKSIRRSNESTNVQEFFQSFDYQLTVEIVTSYLFKINFYRYFPKFF